MRQVPLVSSFMNWLSPLPEEPKTIGRTFNLTSGESGESDLTVFCSEFSLERNPAFSTPQLLGSPDNSNQKLFPFTKTNTAILPSTFRTNFRFSWRFNL